MSSASRIERSVGLRGGIETGTVLYVEFVAASIIAIYKIAPATNCAGNDSPEAMRNHRLHALLIPILTACGGGPPPVRARLAPLVTVEKVQVKDVPVEVDAPVDLRPLAQADVSSKTLGYLDAVLVDRGDRVRQGQVLALVRPSDLPDQLAAARSTLVQAQASVALARSNHDRAEQLAPKALISQQELQQSTSALQAAEAQMRTTEAQISAFATRLGETRIQSPLDGVVSQRRLDPGALVGQPQSGVILTVVRIDVLRAFIAVNELQAQGVRVGQQAYVSVDALPSKRFEGKVVRIAPSFDPTTRTLEAEVRISNSTGELRSGMYGRGAIVLSTHPGALVLPASAVQISSGKHYVFLVEGEVAHRRAVTVGVDGGDWLEITAGLSSAQEVVTAGADGLSDGVKVRVARDVDPFTGKKSVAEGK